MKKTLIALLLVGGGSALFAQGITETSTNENNTTTSSVSTGDYNAYGTTVVEVPTNVRYSFQREYPTVTHSDWYMTPNGQYRVIYKDNMNEDIDVYYYGNSAQSFMVSLPVHQSLTPQDVSTKVRSRYGMGVYDINRVRAANMDYVYHVRLLENGHVRSVWFNENGNEVAAADVYRTAVVANSDIINEVNTSTSADANAANSNTIIETPATSTDTKIKIKSSDGTKIKSKNGEIKVK